MTKRTQAHEPIDRRELLRRYAEREGYAVDEQQDNENTIALNCHAPNGEAWQFFYHEENQAAYRKQGGSIFRLDEL